jgi:hypothetical protein
MMLVVLRDIHSSSVNEKEVRQASRELESDFTAEGRSFSHFSRKDIANSSAFFLDEAQKMERRHPYSLLV